MRIAINTRLLLKGKMDGIGWFTAETTRRMVQAHPEHTFYLLFDRKPDPEFIYGSNVVPVILCPQARHPVLWYMYFEWAVPYALRHYGIDVYLSPDGMMPLHCKVPVLTVIHDLNFEHANDNLKPSHQCYMTRFFPKFARQATRIATVSEYSKTDICHTYGVPEEKVDVVYDGANVLYRPHSELEKADIRHRFTDDKPYLLFVSTILKRKNLTNLLLAFDQVRDNGNDLKLVVVGKRAWWQDELSSAYDTMHYKGDVLMPGHIDHHDLAALMSASEALVYPSFFEGFGIPILEAMYAETAVIASRTTSMPEVGGDAALYVDPASVDDIAHAIERIKDSQLRNTLIARGRIQRTKYSWDRTAALLWQSLTKAVLCITAVLCCTTMQAQSMDNLVYNPSFEEHSRCPDRIEAMGIMSEVDAWWQPTAGSSDYFNSCGNRESSVPRNKMGNQTARTGNAYCGIYCSQEHYREYLQTELRQSLVAGRRYRVSFWVSLAEKSPHSVSTIGALLTTERLADPSDDILMRRETTAMDYGHQVISTPYVPQVAGNADLALDDSKEWMEVSGEFVAKGGEQFLTIGNFNDFNRSGVRPCGTASTPLQGAYYYVDDVSVVCINCVHAIETVEDTLTVNHVVTLRGVYFDVDKSDLLPQSYNDLQHLYNMLATHPGIKIELRGHTDNQGSVEHNQHLSEARAHAVADYLISRGIEAQRISWLGFGKAMPIASNDTPEGRAINRRVEYRILENAQDTQESKYRIGK